MRVAAGAHQTSSLSPLTFQHLSHRGTKVCYSSIEDMGVKCLYPGGDSLLHTGICCKSLVSQVLLKGSKEMVFTGPYTSNQTFDWLQCHPVLTPSDYHLFGPLEKHLAGK